MAINTEAEFSNKLSSISTSLDNGQYEIVVKECGTMFEVVFKKIYSEAISTFPFEDRKKLMDCEMEIGKGKKGVQNFGLGELVGLFRISNLFKKWAEVTGHDLGLITSMNFDSIVELRNKATHDGASCDKFQADLIFSYLKNMLASLGYLNMEKAIKDSFEKTEIPEAAKTSDEEDEEDLADLVLQREKGIIINKADNSRNISFRVDTINSIFDTFLHEAAKISDMDTAKKILYDMGERSGRRFGDVIKEQWELEHEELSYDEKIRMWCEFDSVVGWGRLISNLHVNEEEERMEGDFRIRDNFMCYKRKKKDIKLCDYIKGYCEGVMGSLLDEMEVDITCDCEHCPQERAFSKECVFDVKLKEI